VHHVVVKFESLEERLVRADDALRCGCVERVSREHAAWQAGRVSLEALCERAGEALRAYASETMAALLKTVRPGPEPEDASERLRATFNGRIARTAVAIRDVFSDSSIRHAVAQRLQEQLLRAEAEFRSPSAFSQSSSRAIPAAGAPLRLGSFRLAE
jgi:hypothetical protein